MGEGKPVSKLRPAGVTAEYGVPEQTLANWRCQGRGPTFVRVSSRLIYYDRTDLDSFFSERKVTPGRAG
jgi:hypothetical protein